MTLVQHEIIVDKDLNIVVFVVIITRFGITVLFHYLSIKEWFRKKKEMY